jgi:hypothetical protein
MTLISNVCSVCKTLFIGRLLSKTRRSPAIALLGAETYRTRVTALSAITGTPCRDINQRFDDRRSSADIGLFADQIHGGHGTTLGGALDNRLFR